MRNIPRITVISMVCLAMQSWAVGDVIFSQTVVDEDFEGYATGYTLPATSDTEVCNLGSTNTNRSSSIRLDSGNLLGGGTSNKMVQVNNNAGTSYYSGISINLGFGYEAIRASFDLYDASNSSSNTTNDVRFAAGLRDASTKTDLSAVHNRVTLDRETTAIWPSSGGYSLDTAYSFVVYFNETGSDITYTEGAQSYTLATGMMDVFLNGLLVGNDVTGARDAAADGQKITGFSMWVTGDGNTSPRDANFYTDNLNITATPEPATMLLLAGGGLVALRRRKK